MAKTWNKLGSILQTIIIIWALASAVTIGQTVANAGKLTEVQLLNAELLKMKMQLTLREQQLATCTLESLQNGPKTALENEYLKQVGAEPGSTWNWSTMTPTKPVEKK